MVDELTSRGLPRRMDLVDELREICRCTVLQPCPSYLDNMGTLLHVCKLVGRHETMFSTRINAPATHREVEAPRMNLLEEKGSPRLQPPRGRGARSQATSADLSPSEGLDSKLMNGTCPKLVSLHEECVSTDPAPADLAMPPPRTYMSTAPADVQPSASRRHIDAAMSAWLARFRNIPRKGVHLWH